MHKLGRFFSGSSSSSSSSSSTSVADHYHSSTTENIIPQNAELRSISTNSTKSIDTAKNSSSSTTSISKKSSRGESTLDNNHNHSNSHNNSSKINPTHIHESSHITNKHVSNMQNTTKKLSSVKSNSSIPSNSSTLHIPGGSSSSNTHQNLNSINTTTTLHNTIHSNTINSNTSHNVASGEINFSRSSSVRTSNGSNINVNNNNNADYYVRFKVLADGNHEHHLARIKRQEKLGQMMKDWLGGDDKKRNNAISAVPNIFNIKDQTSSSSSSSSSTKNLPPSLFSTYLSEHKKNSKDPSTIGSPFQQPKFNLSLGKDNKDNQNTESFFEKYGKCQEIIGRGTFGIIRLSHKKINSKEEQLFAVKEFTRNSNEPDSKYSKRLTYEFCISSSLKHGSIISAFDLFKDSKGDYYEVMEYCSGGDLYSLIVAAGKLEYCEADCFFKQIMRAVHYMHSMGVSHRDLKPENILLTQNGQIKITDFGSAECFKTAWEDDIELSNKIKGSSPYIAPEEFTNNEFDPRLVDVWSCGVIYMAMRTGRQLWKEAKIDDEFFHEYLRKRKCEKGYEPIEMLKRARCRNVIYSVLDPIPERRITTLQILNSEWVREINCCVSNH
ncbi:serine/threonine-protein kinase HAL4/sat4 [Pichia californica]|uniref:non-specific serine/threonine protein kinase n=1 Tax=Pichia californica TaxID=460514 RepID=A0A9P6WKC6_9ASCO|nr:serine/threonine-protein kinase HAL4/sat4 [[Candida] californica]KAG0687628.1 serine/threonine-protein kinase HAL4/sat4 [[Candida] californica]